MTAHTLLRTLPGRAYVDAETFYREQANIFERTWCCAARSAELARPGDFRVIQAGRESVLLVRHSDGGLRAFLNVCRHRGARLCAAESGQLTRNVRCGYHAWTYDLDGHLVAAPNLARMTGIDKAEHGLIRVPVRDWLGYAWVCVADDPPDFDDTVGQEVTTRLGDPHAIDAYQIETLSVGQRISYDVHANWKLIVENFMECYHCATIHPELTSILPEFSRGYAAQYYVGHGARFADRAEAFTVTGEGGFAALPALTQQQDRRYYAITVRPQVFINLVPDHVIWHRMYPVAADRTTVVCDWLFAPAVMASGKDLGPSVELFDRVNRQDFRACELTQLSMGSRAYRNGGVLVPSEHHLAGFHEWVERHS